MKRKNKNPLIELSDRYPFGFWKSTCREINRYVSNEGKGSRNVTVLLLSTYPFKVKSSVFLLEDYSLVPVLGQFSTFDPHSLRCHWDIASIEIAIKQIISDFCLLQFFAINNSCPVVMNKDGDFSMQFESGNFRKFP